MLDGDKDLFSKPQIAVFVALRLNSTSKIFLVCNTHLIFNNNRGDMKLGQVHILSKCIQFLKHELTKVYPDDTINIILGSDMNAIPNSGIIVNFLFLICQF